MYTAIVTFVLALLVVFTQKTLTNVKIERDNLLKEIKDLEDLCEVSKDYSNLSNAELDDRMQQLKK